MNVFNQGIDQRLFEYIVNSVENTEYYKLLGIKLAQLGKGTSELTVVTAQIHSNPLGIIHGGLFVSIADAAMGNAIRSLAIRGVTAECSTQFLASTGLNQTLVARGEVLKSGRNLIFARAGVWNEKNLLCSCQGTFFNTGTIDPNH